jgi:UDP-glucose 4-epimerase
VERNPRIVAINLGAGRDYSILEMVATFEKVSHRAIPHRVVARCSGDIAVCYADLGLANTLLNWQAEFGRKRMCQDAWRWQQATSSA